MLYQNIGSHVTFLKRLKYAIETNIYSFVDTSDHDIHNSIDIIFSIKYLNLDDRTHIPLICDSIIHRLNLLTYLDRNGCVIKFNIYSKKYMFTRDYNKHDTGLVMNEDSEVYLYW